MVNEHSKGYQSALGDLNTWLYETIKEWQALKVVDDHQALSLLSLYHEYQLGFLYELRRDDDE